MAIADVRKKLKQWKESRERAGRLFRHAKRNRIKPVRKRAGEIIDIQDEAIKRQKRRIEELQEQQTRRVIPRSEWNALPPKSVSPLINTSNGVFIHHSVAGAPTTKETEKAEMRNLQQIAFSRGFNDISYSFVVFPSGRVYEGRGKNVAGAHTAGYNSTSYAICAAGNYEVQTPTQAMIDTMRWVRRSYLGLGSAALRPHSAVYATACPGKNLRPKLDQL